jgi:fumarate hydratase class II
LTPTRTEHDSFGPVQVPADRLWGAQTQRALQNFDISGELMPRELMRSLAQIKRSSSTVNYALGLQSEAVKNAIVTAVDEVIAGQHANQFPLVVWQTGSGTQTNVNINEVLANRASELMGGSVERDDWFTRTTCDALVHAHGVLKTLAASLMKIANARTPYRVGQCIVDADDRAESAHRL